MSDNNKIIATVELNLKLSRLCPQKKMNKKNEQHHRGDKKRFAMLGITKCMSIERFVIIDSS